MPFAFFLTVRPPSKKRHPGEVNGWMGLAGQRRVSGVKRERIQFHGDAGRWGAEGVR